MSTTHIQRRQRGHGCVCAHAIEDVNGKGREAHQEGSKSQGQASNLGEHRGAQHHQQSGGSKHVWVAHVCNTAVDGPQHQPSARYDGHDACHRLQALPSQFLATAVLSVTDSMECHAKPSPAGHANTYHIES